MFPLPLKHLRGVMHPLLAERWLWYPHIATGMATAWFWGNLHYQRHKQKVIQLPAGRGMRTPTLADGSPMAVEGTLPETELALFVTKLVSRDAQLRVLDACVQFARLHLAQVRGELGCEVGEAFKHFLKPFEPAIVLNDRRRTSSNGPGHHRHGPPPNSHRRLGIALAVNVLDEARCDIPVAAEVNVLQGINRKVLQVMQVEPSSEDMKADQSPVKSLARYTRSITDESDHLVEVSAEAVPLMQPYYEELEHRGGFVGKADSRLLLRQPYRHWCLVGRHLDAGWCSIQLIFKEGSSVAELLLVDTELLHLLASTDEYARQVIIFV